jgi:ribosomal protein S18 acetylase RimI-like enzyme
MNLNIRIATPSDAMLVADLSRETFAETFSGQNSKADMDKYLNEQFTRGKLILEVGAPENTFLLCYHEDQIAGYAKLRDNFNPPGLSLLPNLEIARFYALKEWIGKGIGSYLMKACIQTALERSVKTIWLGVWEHNHRAINFYIKWQFEKFGEQEFLLGSDLQKDWLMKRAVF